MHFLCSLTLDPNTWCIIVEGEVGGIDVLELSTIRFELNRKTFDASHIATPFGVPSPYTTTSAKSVPRPAHVTDPAPRSHQMSTPVRPNAPQQDTR